MSTKEAKARIKINKLLEEAGWRFFDKDGKPANIQVEPNVKISIKQVEGMGENFDKVKNGFIDFLLLDDKGHPFNMIFMVCIYYMLLQINEVAPGEMENALYYMIKDKNRVRDFYGNSNTRNDKLYFGSFAVLGECDVFLLLKITDIDSDLQGELKKLVEERNKCAHANGNITITSQTTIDEKISKYINTLERVFNLLKILSEELYRKTLTNPDFYDSENRSGYLDDDIQIQEEFIKKYFIS